MDEITKKWIRVALVLSVLVISTLIIINTTNILMIFQPPGTSPPTIQIFTSLESHEDVWEFTIQSMRKEGKSLSSISYENINLKVIIRRDHIDLMANVRLRNIKDNLSSEYKIIWLEIDGVRSNQTTIQMNRIIWNDLDGDGRLSIGDMITMEKKGGGDLQILPGDVVYFDGGADNFSCISRRIELPNFTENRMYECGAWPCDRRFYV